MLRPMEAAKLCDTGIEQTYTRADSITVPASYIVVYFYDLTVN